MGNQTEKKVISHFCKNRTVTKIPEIDYTVLSTDSGCMTVVILLRYVSVGTVLIAFALGMLVASLFPYTIAVIIIAAVLILAGLRLCR